MLYEREAQGSIEAVREKLEAATAANGFGVIGVIDLKAKMAAKDVDLEPACQIVEVCNPGKAKSLLMTDMRISTVLPCRISIYEEGGSVKVATMLPTKVLESFDAPGIQPVAQDVEATIIRIVDAACS